MKVEQIESVVAVEDGLPPLQAMVYEELLRRKDEVFPYQGDELLQVFPQMKRSAMNWTLWLLAKNGQIGKMRLRLRGRVTTVYGSHEALELLREHIRQEAGLA
ncbi:MAG: hypothetical protein Q8Q29_02615 [Actinomycetota bacterium]|nr:hypothetical protein [Actinomycetota bacterium]